jgi:hypothetical protein
MKTITHLAFQYATPTHTLLVQVTEFKECASSAPDRTTLRLIRNLPNQPCLSTCSTFETSAEALAYAKPHFEEMLSIITQTQLV